MNIIDQAHEMRRQTTTAAQHLPDELAVESLALFDKWEEYIGKEAPAKLRVVYGQQLYECITTHTVQDNWTPEATPALWKKVSVEEWPNWSQPLGQHDAYAKNAKVTHNDKKWISTTDGNVWEPGVHGWSEAGE